jgi:hypothetical protein
VVWWAVLGRCGGEYVRGAEGRRIYRTAPGGPSVVDSHRGGEVDDLAGTGLLASAYIRAVEYGLPRWALSVPPSRPCVALCHRRPGLLFGVALPWSVPQSVQSHGGLESKGKC